MPEKGGSVVPKQQKEDDEEESLLRSFNAAFLYMLNNIK
jgi:hypothetical protein